MLKINFYFLSRNFENPTLALKAQTESNDLSRWRKQRLELKQMRWFVEKLGPREKKTV